MEETTEHIKGNIKKYYFFQILNNVGFWLPVIVLFWQANGLNMKQILLLQSIYSIAVIILDLPTGAFADYFGKKISLVLSSIFICIGSIVYGYGTGFWQFMVAEILFGVGIAFASGADRAFLHESLISIDKEKEFEKTESRSRGLLQISQSLCSFIGGLIGSISLALTMFASAIPAGLAFLVGLSFAKPKVKLPRDEKTNYFEIIKDSFAIIKRDKRVLWLSLVFASHYTFIWSLFWFIQPYLQALHVPISFFGVIFAFFSLASAFALTKTAFFRKISGDKPFLAVSLLMVIASLLLGTFPSIILVPLWSLVWVFKQMNRTLIATETLPLVPADRGATILSFQSLTGRIIYALYIPILGVISDSWGLNAAIQANGLILAVVALGLLIVEKKLKLGIENV